MVKEQTRDNPVFYVQYAHARACSIFRTAERDLPDARLSARGAAHGTDRPAVDARRSRAHPARSRSGRGSSRAAAPAHEPHRIAFYLYELAAAFHGFWAKGKEDPRFALLTPDDPKLTLARLALVAAVRQVLVNGLSILGVSAPDELS